MAVELKWAAGALEHYARWLCGCLGGTGIILGTLTCAGGQTGCNAAKPGTGIAPGPQPGSSSEDALDRLSTTITSGPISADAAADSLSLGWGGTGIILGTCAGGQSGCRAPKVGSGINPGLQSGSSSEDALVASGPNPLPFCGASVAPGGISADAAADALCSGSALLRSGFAYTRASRA